MFRMFLFISLFLFSFVPVSYAQSESDDINIQEMLVIAKMTGICGIMDSMNYLQKTTKLEGGDEFVDRFW